MEFLPLGSLREYLPKHRVGMAQSLLFAQQICQVSPNLCGDEVNATVALIPV